VKGGVETHGASGDVRTELWVRLAWAPLIAIAAAFLYLGSRPGGTGPLFVYKPGLTLIGLASLLLFVWGLVVSFRRRPLIQGRRLRAFSVVVFSLLASSYPLPYPSSREGRPSRVEFKLPVEGEWVVRWGGDGKEGNILAALFPGQRWGMHLVREVDGVTCMGDGAKAEDHHCFGESVFAPASGVVVRVVEGQAPSGSSLPFGDHLVIEVAEGEFLFLTQLLPGSLRPEVGDEVEQGELLARVGGSGCPRVSPMPHLGLHLQTSPEPMKGEGIPWEFRDYSVAGVHVAEGLPTGGVGSDGGLLGARVSRVESSRDI